MFVVALRLSMPILGTLFLVSIAMGLLAKAAPQMNLLMIGFPISITVSFIILLVLMPAMIIFFSDFMEDMFKDVWNLMLGTSNG
jgi:flagellar biosynthetic protein FliR